MKQGLFKLNQAGQIKKTYLAWVQGSPPPFGQVDIPVAHHPKDRRKMYLPKDQSEAQQLKARSARTYFKQIKIQDKFSLLELEIHKGARHQIRLHLASLGHAILGDVLYGNPADACSRLYLHAAKVELNHPVSQQALCITAKTPSAFKTLI